MPDPPPDAPPRQQNVRTVQYDPPTQISPSAANHLFVGNYNGINFNDIDNPAKTMLENVSGVSGRQANVSVTAISSFIVAEAANGRSDCGHAGNSLPAGYTPPPPPPTSAPGAPEAAQNARSSQPRPVRGVRIFDSAIWGIPSRSLPCQSCRGSHTHTLVIDPERQREHLCYISGTQLCRRQAEELANRCSDGRPVETNPDTALFPDRHHQGAAWHTPSR